MYSQSAHSIPSFTARLAALRGSRRWALALALGLPIAACGPSGDPQPKPEPAPAQPWPVAVDAASSRPRSVGKAAARVEIDLAQLGRARVDARISERDLRDRYIVEVAGDFDPQLVAQEYGIQPRFTFTAALRGFSAELQPGQLERLENDARIRSIEPVQLMMTTTTTQTMDGDGQPWGLDRISQYGLPLNNKYSYDYDGAGVRAYVIDTGLDKFHPDIEFRALRSFDAFGGDGEDLNGHGTHVAGTIGGKTYGVAKGVQLRGVRVFDATGHGTTDTVIAGVDWVMANGTKPAVVNMSLSGTSSDALKRAVNNLAGGGFFTAVAAGNRSDDACKYSPANATGVVSVGAVDRSDQQADFSNYGRCVTLYAPGVAIRSTWLMDTVKDLSGTSMASPHVAGAAALYKQARGDADSPTLKAWLLSEASRDVLSGLGKGSPNLLLFQPL